jgi:hypothetical protein
MSGGATAALVLGGTALAGLGAYLFLRPGGLSGPSPILAAQPLPQQSSAKPVMIGAPPPAPTAVASLASGFSGLNQAGCVAAASKVGAGGLAGIGCSTFLKYATPLGIAGLANTEIEKIPVVGTAVAQSEHAVAQVASVPLKAASSVVHSIASLF